MIWGFHHLRKHPYRPGPGSIFFEACDEVLYQDEVIIKEGDQGHEFFVIKEGEAEVLIMQKKQARIVA